MRDPHKGKQFLHLFTNDFKASYQTSRKNRDSFTLICSIDQTGINMNAVDKENKEYSMKIIQQDLLLEERKQLPYTEKRRNLVLTVTKQPPGTSLEFDI